jgi:predicted Zn-dependent peptidase
MKNQYTASNTIVCLSGNFPEKRILSKVQKHFSRIIKKKPKEKAKVFEEQLTPRVILEERPTNQTHLCLGVRSYNLFHPSRYPQELLSAILGGMMSSRLFTEIRGKLGLAYYINTSFNLNPDTGYLVTQAGVDNNKVEKAIEAILKEYKKISEEKIPQAEIKKAKDYLKGKTTLLFEPSDAKASFYADQELLEKKIMTLKEIFKIVDRIKEEDIRKTAKDIFSPQRLNLALVGPFKEKKKFEKILKI